MKQFKSTGGIMCGCFKGIRWGKVLISAVVFTIIDQIVRMVGAQFAMSYYTNPALANLWSKVMMPNAGPPPASFFVISILFSFITGIILAKLYEYMKPTLDKGGCGFICFFMMVLSLSIVLGFLPMYLCLNIPLKLQLMWFLETAIVFFVSFMIFAKILK